MAAEQTAPKKDNRAYYDEFADWYENERHRGYHALLDDLEFDLIEPMVVGKDVLEVGCGTGLILRRVEPLANRAMGIDISAGMLQQCLQRGLWGVQADVTSLPFADESFDVVYSFKVLAHVESIERALSEIARVTRPGGRMVLEFYNPWSIRYLAKRLGGPQKISSKTHEGAVFTRWDSPMDLRGYLPRGVRLVDYAGVRVLTPMASVHKLPLLGGALRKLEFKSRDSALRYFGGFLVAILERS